MRCGRCGNENGEANRFCGMCGAPLAGRQVPTAGQPGGQVPVAVPTGSVTAPRQAPVSDLSSPVQTVPRPSPDLGRSTGPVITGPSFLGLSTPGPARTGIWTSSEHQAGGERDELRPSSRNLDYLLEDEEEPKSGWGKLILIVIALALAGGFGYLRWKQGGFDWLNAGEKKPSATAPASDAAQSSADSGGTAGRAATPAVTAPQGGAGDTAATPTPGSVTANPTDSPAPPATASQSAPPQDTGPQTKAVESSAPTGSASADPPSPDSASKGSSSDSDKQPPAEEPPAVVKPRSTKPAAAPKPSAARASDAVTEAERFLYGRGVRQDCDHGMRLLKPAAEQSNPKAMVSLGALYSTGTCTPRDLPTAYRWFALALHKQPDNQALQDDLQKLWSQMTQPERQLAIKLSQ